MDRTCSFCGRGESEVSAFFRPSETGAAAAGESLCICDRCIEGCHQHLAAKPTYPIESPERQQLRQCLNESITETLIRAILDMQHRDALLAAFAERAQLAKINPKEPPDPVALNLLPAEFIRENRILPWRIEDGCLVVAFYNPLVLLDLYEEIVRLAGMPIRPALLARDELKAAMERYFKMRE